MISEPNWFYRPESIPKLWKGGIAILAVTVLAEFIAPVHAHFEIADWPGFSAVYGFVACAVLVVGAKLLGFLIKRPDTYYEPDATSDMPEPGATEGSHVEH